MFLSIIIFYLITFAGSVSSFSLYHNANDRSRTSKIHVHHSDNQVLLGNIDFLSSTVVPASVDEIKDEARYVYHSTDPAVGNNIKNEIDNEKDIILSKLNSPAPTSFLVIHQSILRLNMYYDHLLELLSEPTQDKYKLENTKVEIKETVQDIKSLNYLVKPKYRIKLHFLPLQKKNLVKNNNINNNNIKVLWNIDEKKKRTNSNVAAHHQTILELAHEALKVSQSTSSRSSLIKNTNNNGKGVEYTNSFQNVDDLVEEIAKKAMRRLSCVTFGTDIQARQSADAAYCFALAGMYKTPELYNQLAFIALRELKRCGHRKSFKSKYIYHIVEKFACAGLNVVRQGGIGGSIVDDNVAKDLYSYAGQLLSKKESSSLHHHDDDSQILLIRELLDGTFNLFSGRVALWLWRFSSRQPKLKTQNERRIQQRHGHLSNLFKDTTKPLVIDLGSGMGLSLLGLSSINSTNEKKSTNISSSHHEDSSSSICMADWDWSQYNFIGADLNHQFVSYSNSIAERWNLTDRMRFVSMSTNELLNFVLLDDSYEGHVQLILVQFPTPFSLSKEKGGQEEERETKGDSKNIQGGKQKNNNNNNPQLPMNETSEDFMVNDSFLKLSYDTLMKKKKKKNNTQEQNNYEKGFMLIQSNCEDVAVSIRARATQKQNTNDGRRKDAFFRCANIPKIVPISENISDEEDNMIICDEESISKRTRNWLDSMQEKKNNQDDKNYRAQGYGWSSEPLLPREGATETELMCMFQNKPVHRFILIPNSAAAEQ